FRMALGMMGQFNPGDETAITDSAHVRPAAGRTVHSQEMSIHVRLFNEILVATRARELIRSLCSPNNLSRVNIHLVTGQGFFMREFFTALVARESFFATKPTVFPIRMCYEFYLVDETFIADIADMCPFAGRRMHL